MLFISRQVRDRDLKTLLDFPHDDSRRLPARNNSEDAAVQMCKALLDCGADPNATTSDEVPWTPMHCVANSSWMKVAHLLLEHGGSAFSATMCSPYCWAGDSFMVGIPGEPATMRELLKAHLSEEQMNAIHALHHSRSG